MELVNRLMGHVEPLRYRKGVNYNEDSVSGRIYIKYESRHEGIIDSSLSVNFRMYVKENMVYVEVSDHMDMNMMFSNKGGYGRDYGQEEVMKGIVQVIKEYMDEDRKREDGFDGYVIKIDGGSKAKEYLEDQDVYKIDGILKQVTYLLNEEMGDRDSKMHGGVTFLDLFRGTPLTRSLGKVTVVLNRMAEIIEDDKTAEARITDDRRLEVYYKGYTTYLRFQREDEDVVIYEGEGDEEVKREILDSVSKVHGFADELCEEIENKDVEEERFLNVVFDIWEYVKEDEKRFIREEMNKRMDPREREEKLMDESRSNFPKVYNGGVNAYQLLGIWFIFGVEERDFNVRDSEEEAKELFEEKALEQAKKKIEKSWNRGVKGE